MSVADVNTNTYFDSSTHYYYDDNGNMTAKQASIQGSMYAKLSSAMSLSGRSTDAGLEIYRYDAFNRLTNYNSGDVEASYTYNANNLRASKTVNRERTDFVWNGQNLAAETTNGVTTAYTYDVTGIVMSKSGNDSTTRYIKDPHGNVVATAKGNNVMNEYLYSAFGNQMESTITLLDPFRYCGEYLDSESGLTYLRNRYYDSDTGRFITEDPYWNVDNMIYGDSDSNVPDISAIMQSSNLFVYCMNNPINLWDPSGKEYNTVSEFIKDYSATRVSDNYQGRYTVVSLNGHTEWIYWDPDMNKKTYGIDSRNDYGQLEMQREGFLKIFGINSEKMAIDYSISVTEAAGRTLIINGVSVSGTGLLPLSGPFSLMGGFGQNISSGQYRQEQYYAKFGGWVYITRVTIDPKNNVYVSPGRQSVQEGAMSVSDWKEQLKAVGYK